MELIYVAQIGVGFLIEQVTLEGTSLRRDFTKPALVYPDTAQKFHSCWAKTV
jgi:hypothetical protein